MKKKFGTCPHCKEQFENYSGSMKFCSRICAAKDQAKRRSEDYEYSSSICEKIGKTDNGEVGD